MRHPERDAVRRPMRLANKEVISVLGRKPISQGREPQPTGRKQLRGLKGTSGIPSQNLFPPLAESPLLIHLSEYLNPSRKRGRSHTSLLLTGVRGEVSTFDIPKKRNRYIHGNETTNI